MPMAIRPLDYADSQTPDFRVVRRKRIAKFLRYSTYAISVLSIFWVSVILKPFLGTGGKSPQTMPYVKWAGIAVAISGAGLLTGFVAAAMSTTKGDRWRVLPLAVLGLIPNAVILLVGLAILLINAAAEAFGKAWDFKG